MPGYMKGKANAKVIAGLNVVLADTFLLYFKTHACHWNVEGIHFAPLHDFFGAQYEEMWKATDELAERIRALGGAAPVSLTALAAHARLKEAKKVTDAKAMLKDLLADHEALIETLNNVAELADEADDIATEDLMVARLHAHEKMAWMIRAHLK